MSVTLKLARSFIALAATESFTRAAQSLNVTQPALTVHIKQLEARLGVTLFERDTRSVALTPVGRMLAPEFREALAGWDGLVARARGMNARVQETLRIACLPSVSGTLLPEIVSEFSRRHPEVEVVVRDAVWERVLHLIRSGEVDLGIGGVRSSLPDLDIVELADEPMFVMFPPGHPIGRLDAVGIGDVAKYPLVLVGKHSSLRRSVEAALGSHAAFAFPVKEVSYSASAVGLVRAGFGLTVLPSTAIELRAETALHWRPIVDCFRKLALLRRRGSRPSTTSAAFGAVVAERLSRDLTPFPAESGSAGAPV